MLKIIEKGPEGADSVAYLFHFNSADARTEANAVKDVLSKLITEVRSGDPNIPKPAGRASSPPEPAPENSGSASAQWFNDDHLKDDIDLQQSLMKADQGLSSTYLNALQSKPDSISDAVFNTQFWSTRTSLLRAHAIATNQQRGPQNILPTIKPRTVVDEKDNSEKLVLSITPAQALEIFKMHPLIERLYNENVPRISEAEFWFSFFNSSLAQKLKGNRITDVHNPQPLFDRHDAAEDIRLFKNKIMGQQVPHIIDLEGNEENQGGFKGGNRKDVEMQYRRDVLPLQMLNSISSKLLATVAPADVDPDGANGLDDDTYHELALRDLQGDSLEHRIILNVNEQSRFFSKHESAESALFGVFAKQVPSEVLFEVVADLDLMETDETGGSDIHMGIGVDEDSDSDDEAPKKAHVGSRAARIAADREIMDGVLQQRSEKYGNDSSSANTMGLPAFIVERCALTHATTIEFLHQFWNAFLSGDPDRAGDLQHLADALGRSMDRIEAVANDAEKEREEIIAQKKKELTELYNRTRKKIKWRPAMVTGGRTAALKLMQPAIDALNKGVADYQRALAAEGIQATTEG
jgi:transcription initiation factor TFIIH subunit 1